MKSVYKLLDKIVNFLNSIRCRIGIHYLPLYPNAKMYSLFSGKKPKDVYTCYRCNKDVLK